VSFKSIEFLYFLPVVTVFYFLLPHRFRWALLLGASYYFYMCWKPEYLLLIVVSTLIDYVVAIRMESARGHGSKRAWLAASLVSGLGLLFAFKYFNFIADSINGVFELTGIRVDLPFLNVLLPVGISFYTFQKLSYIIDVYRGDRRAERHIGVFALYVAFFPQLVAGPIERSTRLMPQFFEKHRFDYGRVTDGLRLIAWGFFKKLVIADRLAVTVNEVYGAPDEYSGMAVMVATYCFAFQIFCDFSAYSDIAIGSARMLGYELMCNFRQPYLSKSVSEFWRRWHISLSTWFRDYLYIPLGGSRRDSLRVAMNLMIVFVLSGLWHGANWTFFIWGGLHGFLVIVDRLTVGPVFSMESRCRRYGMGWLFNAVRVFITFNLICVAWLFFRAERVSDAICMLRQVMNLDIGNRYGVGAGMNGLQLIATFGAVCVMEAVHVLQCGGKGQRLLMRMPFLVRWLLYYLLVVITLAFGVFNDNAQFIYFQF